MIKGILLSAGAAALLIGCSTPAPRQAYAEPQAGPTATVSFRNASPGRTAIALYEDANACTHRRGLPALLIGEQRELTVPAGKPLAFTFRYSIPNQTPDRSCEVTASFDTAPGEHYLATLKPRGDTSCTVELVRLVRGANGSYSPRGGVTALLRSPVKSSTESGPFCTGLR